MQAIIIDDESYVLRYMERICLQVSDLNIIGCFENAIQALEFLKEHEVELVLTDIDMPGINGLQAVQQIRKIHPDIGIIFVTGYEQYALKAFELEAISYIMKPCSVEALKKAVQRAIRLLPEKKKRVEINTFGYFMIKIDGIPFHFSNSKAEELIALLVDREGASVTMEQATDILWEGRPYDDAVKRLYRKATGYLNQLFRKKNVHFFVSDRGSSHVIPSEFDCDYYRLLKGDVKAIKLYNSTYMSQYSWAEPTIGRIEKILNKNI